MSFQIILKEHLLLYHTFTKQPENFVKEYSQNIDYKVKNPPALADPGLKNGKERKSCAPESLQAYPTLLLSKWVSGSPSTAQLDGPFFWLSMAIWAFSHTSHRKKPQMFQ